MVPEDLAEFYSAWVDELLHDAVNRLLDDYHKSARGDCFRVLYGRICEQMANREIAQHLRLKLSTVENYYKDARDRLGILPDVGHDEVPAVRDPVQADDQWHAFRDAFRCVGQAPKGHERPRSGTSPRDRFGPGSRASGGRSCLLSLGSQAG